MKRFVSGKAFVELKEFPGRIPGMSRLDTDTQVKTGGFCVRKSGEPSETGEGS